MAGLKPWHPKSNCVRVRRARECGSAQTHREKLRKGHSWLHRKQYKWKENSVTVGTIIGQEAACKIVSSPSLTVYEQDIDRLRVGMLESDPLSGYCIQHPSQP